MPAIFVPLWHKSENRSSNAERILNVGIRRASVASRLRQALDLPAVHATCHNKGHVQPPAVEEHGLSVTPCQSNREADLDAEIRLWFQLFCQRSNHPNRAAKWRHNSPIHYSPHPPTPLSPTPATTGHSSAGLFQNNPDGIFRSANARCRRAIPGRATTNQHRECA